MFLLNFHLRLSMHNLGSYIVGSQNKATQGIRTCRPSTLNTVNSGC